MAPQSEAMLLMQKAEKKAGSSTGWFSSSKSKYEEAGDLFQSAANRFKLENSFVEAGDAFSKEAECREKSDFEYDAANAWWNASKAYKQAGRADRASVIHAPWKSVNRLFSRHRCSRPNDQLPHKAREV